MSEPEIIYSKNLDDDIDRLMRQGFRMDMVMPADAPREVLMSNAREHVRIVSKNRQRTSNVEWAVGRAGMMYRDLISDRLGGKVIASHIRIVEGGEVADSVHYHKIDFQLIFCLNGAIRVVYEDQGEPFWLKPGDCVLQPPEIRHRVLEAEAGSEVIEITSPAEHETWFDHELKLPTNNVNRDRIFRDQRFVRHLEADSKWKPIGSEGIVATETNIPGVSTLRDDLSDRDMLRLPHTDQGEIMIMVGGMGVTVTLEII